MRAEMMATYARSPALRHRRLDDVALAMLEGTAHQLAPGVVISCLCGVLQQDIVAYQLDGHQA